MTVEGGLCYSVDRTALRTSSLIGQTMKMVSVTSEFWLGLAQMHCARTELRVDLEDFNSNTGYAQYTDFGIGDASSNYVLTVAGYSGTAGDSLTPHHHNQPFSTRDHDNDNHSGNCAQSGAWWHNACYTSNLNGPYSDMRWFSFTSQPLKFSEIKLRRA